MNLQFWYNFLRRFTKFITLKSIFSTLYEFCTSPNSSIIELNPLQIFLRSLYYIAKALGSFFGSIIHLPKLLFAHKIWWSINMFVAVNPLGQKGHFFLLFCRLQYNKTEIGFGFRALFLVKK